MFVDRTASFMGPPVQLKGFSFLPLHEYPAMSFEICHAI
jgi:hypothetical protein